MIIKVCGMVQVQQISELCDLNIDYGGLIFYPQSPRYFVGKINPEELAELVTLIKLTGVFVNEDREYVKEMIDLYHLKAVQLCGSESVEDCGVLKEYAEVIKVLHCGDEGVGGEFISEYEDAVDYLLFDTKSAGFGGSGKKFDWSNLSSAAINRPFFLSGGISADDTEAVRMFQHPKFFGVDINSRFEVSPGVKDINKIKQFMNQLNRNEVSGR